MKNSENFLCALDFTKCLARNVFWREKSQDDNTESELEESSPFVPRMTTAIYDDGDCENFELFDAVVKLLKAIEHKTLYVKIFQINRCNS
jgi:hypothetical protein